MLNRKLILEIYEKTIWLKFTCSNPLIFTLPIYLLIVILSDRKKYILDWILDVSSKIVQITSFDVLLWIDSTFFRPVLLRRTLIVSSCNFRSQSYRMIDFVAGRKWWLSHRDWFDTIWWNPRWRFVILADARNDLKNKRLLLFIHYE